MKWSPHIIYTTHCFFSPEVIDVTSVSMKWSRLWRGLPRFYSVQSVQRSVDLWCPAHCTVCCTVPACTCTPCHFFDVQGTVAYVRVCVLSFCVTYLVSVLVLVSVFSFTSVFVFAFMFARVLVYVCVDVRVRVCFCVRVGFDVRVWVYFVFSFAFMFTCFSVLVYCMFVLMFVLMSMSVSVSVFLIWSRSTLASTGVRS